MKMLTDIAHWMQGRLRRLPGDERTLVFFVHGIINSVPEGSIARWQLGVDTINRTVTCGLVGVDQLGGFPDRASFFHAIRTLSPDDASGKMIFNGRSRISGPGLWNGTFVYGTERLSKLIDTYFRPSNERDGELNAAFIDALEQIFAENGVPWSDKPLLPITSAATGAAAGTVPR